MECILVCVIVCSRGKREVFLSAAAVTVVEGWWVVVLRAGAYCRTVHEIFMGATTNFALRLLES